MKKVRKEYFGWFDNPSQETPTHDPGVENGLCPICCKKLTRPLKTISVLDFGQDEMGVFLGERSYFYRAHKACYDSCSEEEIADIDVSVFEDKLNRKMN